MHSYTFRKLLSPSLRWLPMLVAGAAVLILAMGAPTQAAPAQPTHEVPEIELVPGAVIYGDEAGGALDFVQKGKAFFDYNGDGKRDFLVKYWTRAHHPDLRHEHLDILLGRETWPEKAKVSDLDGRVILEFPNPKDQKPDDPVYKLTSNLDMNGDRRDDLMVQMDETVRDRPAGMELRFFYGQAEPLKFVNVAEDTPDLRIRQPSPPRNSTEERSVIMPDKVNSSDLNGDGQLDLALGSCSLVGPGHTNASKGALFIYLGPYGTGSLVDLSKETADVVIYGSNEIDVCTAQMNDVDGDGINDILFTGKKLKNSQEFHYGALVKGRSEWDATNEVDALVTTRYMSASANGDVDISLSDYNGDRKRDVVGKAYTYRTPTWTEEVLCVWLAGEAQPAEQRTNACGMRFTGKWPSDAVDINGDGNLDYLVPMDQRGTKPFVWRIGLGPIPLGGEMKIVDDADSGDYVLTVPYLNQGFRLRFGNVAGGGDNEIVHSEPEARQVQPDDGRITLHFGPLVANDPDRPTPTPPAPTDVPTATPTEGPPLPTNTPVPEKTAPPEIELVPGAVIYGDEAGGALDFVQKGKAFFDYNGDGKRDFLVKYWTRAHHPDLRHEHLDILLGRETWPEKAKVSDLDGRVILEFPNPKDQKPDDPVYKLTSNLDMNGDRRDDLMVQMDETVRDRPAGMELRFFYGQAEPLKFVNVAEDTPDLRIRQPSPPRNSTEERSVIMPDKVNSSDLNGDGQLDLALGSCSLVGPGHTNASKGALFIYLGPYGTGSLVDLSKETADVVIYGSNEIDVCTAQMNDVDGDGINDILFTGKKLKSSQEFHYGALVKGRSEWDATNEVDALVTTRYMSANANGDVDISLSDYNGDRKRDVVGKAYTYRTPTWTEEVLCVWLAGEDQPAEQRTDACGMRFTGKWPSDAVDINGDGNLDYLVPMDQRGTKPFVWRIGLGPIPPGGEMKIVDAVDSGDYVLTVPYLNQGFRLRFGNVAGSGDNEIVHSEPEARVAQPDDGRITLHFGPLVAPPPTPTPTATVPAPTDTPVAPTTPVPTVTSPTATAIPVTETPEPTGGIIYLPICSRSE